MSKFIKIVLILYVFYYTIMVLFDLFIKKGTNNQKEDDGEKFQIEDFKTEDVLMTDEELVIEKNLEKQKEAANIPDEENEDNNSDGDEQFRNKEIKQLEKELAQEEGVQTGPIECQGMTIDEMKALVASEGNDFMNFINN